MAMIYTMQRGVNESVLMSLDYDSGLATIQYFNAGGVEFVPTGAASIPAFVFRQARSLVCAQ